MTTLAVNPTDSASVLSAFGALGVLLVVFAESGLLVVGFFLPGDTLLFPAGVLCAGGDRPGPHLTLWQVMVCAAVGAIAGAQVGFLIGRHGGAAFMARNDNPRLEKGLARAEEMLARYGYGKAIVIGRFVPLVRSVLSPAAGALGVPVRVFTFWQVIGALAWSQSLVLAGYALGAAVPHVERYLLPLVALIVLASFLPLLIEHRRSRRERRDRQEEQEERDERDERDRQGRRDPDPDRES
ncbi:MAG TPA: DedA family protein [Streptomyces sp.]